MSDKKLKDMLIGSHFYDPDGNNYPQDMTFTEVAEQASLHPEKRQVAKTVLPDGVVSTVSLWISPHGTPFETMFFPNGDDGPAMYARYKTKQEAITGHEAAVKYYGEKK